MSEQITIEKKQKVLTLLDSCYPNVSPEVKSIIRDVVSILSGSPLRYYKPGEIIHLSRNDGEAEPYLVCVTGEANKYDGIRFCSLKTGRKAGEVYIDPYRLFHGDVGITSEQIEKYLNFQYKVVE